MGFTFPGECRTGFCPDCAARITCDAGSPPDSGFVHCHLCGCDRIPWPELVFQPGTACEVEPVRGPIDRWDVVAVKLQENPEGIVWGIKRVLGLPGETIGLDGGELWIHGQLVAKPRSILQQLRIPLFDLRHVRPGSGLGPHFAESAAEQHGPPAGTWSFPERRLLFAPRGTEAGEMASRWSPLHFVPVRGYPAAPGPVHPARITDFMPYNQGKSSTLTEVFDLVVEFSLESGETAEFGCSFERPDGRVVDVEFLRLPRDHVEIRIGSRKLASAGFQIAAGTIAAEVLVVDDRVEVWMGGRRIAGCGIPPATAGRSSMDRVEHTAATPGQPQFLLKARRGSCRLRELKLWRDWYLRWSDPFDGPEEKERSFRIPDDGYFLVGDNLPVSRDSRSGRNSCPTRSAILGRVRVPG